MIKYALRLGIIKNTYCDYNQNTYDKYANNIVSGKDFKKLFPKYKAIKIIGNNKNYFKYNIGLNQDTYKLSMNKCSHGGLYFCDLSDLYNYLDEDYGYEIAIIRLDDNSNIFIEDKKCKTDFFYIDKILSIDKYINDLSQEDKIEFIKKNCNAIRYISNPDEEVQLQAVKKDGLQIQFIINPSKKIQFEAVKQDGCAILFLNYACKEVQLEAVKQNGLAIEFIKNPDKDIQLEAVKQNGLAIEFIKNPNKDIQLEAVKQNGLASKFINNSNSNLLVLIRKYIHKLYK